METEHTLSKKGNPPNPLQYAEPRAFLVQYFEWKQNQNPGFSLRAWAKRMDFNNHSLLSLLLRGVRPITVAHLPHLQKGLSLHEQDWQYFEWLVRMHAAETETERNLYESKLRLAQQPNAMVYRDVEVFRYISQWIHAAILEMTELKDFSEDPVWIVKKLEFPTTVSEVRQALERLESLGLLVRTEHGLKKSNPNLMLAGDKASQAVRDHHRQMINLALRAVETQRKTERILGSFTVTMDAETIGKAEELFLEFRQRFDQLLEKSSGNATYQCNFQLFRLTKLEKKGGI